MHELSHVSEVGIVIAGRELGGDRVEEVCLDRPFADRRCPYDARALDEGKFYEATPQDYETAASYEYGVKRNRKADEAPIGKARKCHFCMHRLSSGMLPECVTTCIGRATYYGDANDSTSLVAQLIKANKTQFLKAKKGTKPRVYYISDKNLEVIYG